MSHSTRWSSQFGLYKYSDDTNMKKNNSCKRCIRYGLIILITFISITMVYLLLFDLSSATQESDRKNSSKHSNQENYYIKRSLSAIKLPLRSNATTNNELKTDITISKENISFLESSFLDSEYNRSGSIESKIMPERIVNSASSPKPFNFEYKDTYPMPFHKNERPKTDFAQLSNYRSSTKMKNIDQLVRYMQDQLFNENNDNEKIGNSNPKRIKFSGIYLRPRKSNSYIEDSNGYRKNINRKRFQENKKNESLESFKDKSDPFYPFKPNQPGDINLLAEKKFRFSPTFMQNQLANHKIKQPIKYIPLEDYTKCDEPDCNPDENYNSESNPSVEVEEYDFEESPYSRRIKTPRGVKFRNKNRPLSVMLDIYPMEDEDEETMAFPEHLKEPSKTRKKNKYKYKPSSIYPYSSSYEMPQPPNYNYYPNYGYNPTGYYHHSRQTSNKSQFRPQIMLPPELQTGYIKKRNHTNENSPKQMLVHLNLYPKKKIIRKTNLNSQYEIIDRRSKKDVISNGDDIESEHNITDDDIILTNFTKDARRSIIDAILTKYNKGIVETPLKANVENMTIDDVETGYSFQLPNPELPKHDLPDGLSESAIHLLSLTGLHEKSAIDKEQSRHVSKRNGNDVQMLTNVDNVNTTENYSESFTVSNMSTNDSLSSEQNVTSGNSTINFEEFIAVPLLDIK